MLHPPAFAASIARWSCLCSEVFGACTGGSEGINRQIMPQLYFIKLQTIGRRAFRTRMLLGCEGALSCSPTYSSVFASAAIHTGVSLAWRSFSLCGRNLTPTNILSLCCPGRAGFIVSSCMHLPWKLRVRQPPVPICQDGLLIEVENLLHRQNIVQSSTRRASTTRSFVGQPQVSGRPHVQHFSKILNITNSLIYHS